MPYPPPRDGDDQAWLDRDGSVHRDGDALAPGRRLQVTPASQVQIRRQRWLWSNRIALAALTLLAGREGLGKSTIANDLVARVTRGGLDGERAGAPSKVIILHSEDARDTTIVPRLTAAGADLDRVIFVDAVHRDDDGEHEQQVVLPSDVTELADLAVEHDVALVVLDAATSVIDSRLDGDKDRQMRRGLESISRGLAERAGCAVLGIVHFGKRDGGDTGKLILGSIAWSQVARSVLAVARDDDTGSLIVSTTKANLSPGDTPSLSARLVDAVVQTDDGPTHVGRVEWTGETDQRAQDLLAGPDAATGGDRTELDAARKWLRAYLEDSGLTAPSRDVKKAARTADIAERTLQRARAALGVTTSSGGFPRESMWTLPDPSSRADADGAHVSMAPLAQLDPTCGNTGATVGTTGPNLSVVPTPVHGTTDGTTDRQERR